MNIICAAVVIDDEIIGTEKAIKLNHLNYGGVIKS
jgi:hypothetical protein